MFVDLAHVLNSWISALGGTASPWGDFDRIRKPDTLAVTKEPSALDALQREQMPTLAGE